MMVVVLQHRPGFPLLLPGVVGRAVVLRFLSGRAAFLLLRACGILVLSPGKGSVFWSISSLLSRGFSMPENPCGHGVYIQVHFSTFLGHCEKPCGSRRFVLQCRWAHLFVPRRVLWYTCLRPRAIFGLILSVVVVARGFFMPSHFEHINSMPSHFEHISSAISALKSATSALKCHCSAFQGHCENPYGSRRFVLQCRSVPFACGHVLWYTCR